MHIKARLANKKNKQLHARVQCVALAVPTGSAGIFMPGFMR